MSCSRIPFKQEGHDLTYVMDGFKYLCGLPLVVGAIDITQIHIQKPKG
jgi:hypothetical protein